MPASAHHPPDNAVAVLPDFVFPLLTAAAVVLAAFGLWGLRVRLQRRQARRRAAGYQLMDCLKAYSAWIDWHRDEPLLHQDPEAADLPAALAHTVRIKDQHFADLSPLVLKLLHTHRALVQYLWEQNLGRRTEDAPPAPHYADPRYQQLRDAQDGVLDSLFVRCRQLIGDDGLAWKRTRSDFSFSADADAPSTPHPS